MILEFGFVVAISASVGGAGQHVDTQSHTDRQICVRLTNCIGKSQTVLVNHRNMFCVFCFKGQLK